MYSLIIVDDEPEILAGLCTIVHWNELGFDLKAAFSHAEAAKDWLLTHTCDVLFTDIVMNETSGLDLAAWVREHHPATRILLVSAYHEFSYAQRAIELQVFRYLLKPTRMEELQQSFWALRKELDGESHPIAEISPVQESYIVRKVREFVDAHLAEDISLPKIANALHYNPSYLSRTFKAEFGKSINEYINLMRIQFAQRLLSDTNMKVYAVARASGFQNERYFARQFLAIAGEPPSQYRKRKR